MRTEQVCEQTKFPQYVVDLPEEYLDDTTIKAVEETELGKNLHGPFDTIEELMEALNAPD